MSERPEPIVVETVDQLAATAGRTRIDDDAITMLHRTCRAFIADANMSQHTRSMANIKADELVFWLRAGANKDRLP